MLKFSKKLKLSLIGLFSVFLLSGCSSVDMVPLVNPTQPIMDVANRNIAVLNQLKTAGVISESLCTSFTKAIDNQAKSYIYLLDVSLNDDESLENRDKAAKQILPMLQDSLVNVLGVPNPNTNEVFGVIDEPSDCPNDKHSGPYFRTGSGVAYIPSSDKTLFDNLSLSKDSNYKMKPNKEPISLKFIDENNLNSFVNEINTKVWVLDESKIDTEEKWNQCLALLKEIKSTTDTKTKNNAIKNLASSYFKDSGAYMYNYTVEDILCEESEDNSAGLGESSDMNDLNKDIIVNGTFTGESHNLVKENNVEDCEVGTAQENVGVYQFRIQEFDKDFINEIMNKTVTNNKYITTEPTTSTDLKVALLMEYPVAVIDNLTTGDNNTGWKLNFRTSGMKVNIFNGEMLVRESNGDYTKINEETDGDNRIYRVMAENLGYNTETGKNSSFFPRGEVDLGIGEVTQTEREIEKLKLGNLVQTGDISDYGLEFNKIYPFNYLYTDGIDYKSTTSTGGKDYVLLQKSSDPNPYTVEVSMYNNTESTSYKEVNQLTSWKGLWELFEKVRAKAQANDPYETYGTLENYPIYKIYNALKDKGLVSSETDSISNYFSKATIYNSLNSYFLTYDGLGALDKYYGSAVDKLFTSFRKTGDYMSFTYGSNNDLYNVYEPMGWSDTKIDEIQAAIDSLGTEYSEMYEKLIALDPDGIDCKYNICTVFKPLHSSNYTNGPDTGKILTYDESRDSANLRFNSDTNKYEFTTGGISYECYVVYKSDSDLNVDSISTAQFALKDYLELTYMPGVVDTVEDEPFIATGRRITINKFEGEKDEVIGYYADKYGDPITFTGNASDTIDVKVSDLVDYSSGEDGFYDKIAKGLEFDGNQNKAEIQAEINKPDSDKVESLYKVFVGVEQDANVDTGLISDAMLLPFTVYSDKVNPVLKFTSQSSGDMPGLDSEDVGNSDVPPSLYYGLCVNTHAYTTGLYNKWIDVSGDGGDIGSLNWWNNWLQSHNYKYRINIDKLKELMNGIYAVSLADLEETIVFNENTLKVINTEINEETEVYSQSLFRTLFMLLGGFFLMYGIMMLACWTIDVNMVNGPGLLTMITFGKFVAIRDSSEIPRIVDGKVYADFKYLCVVTVLLMILGIILIVFDVQFLWNYINSIFTSLVDAFQDILLNR